MVVRNKYKTTSQKEKVEWIIQSEAEFLSYASKVLKY